ncbi:MAG: RelA/SpoT AH/RIS domain-containing protein, partial [Gammaproteobacteria bacterium]
RVSTPVDFAYAVHTDLGNSCVAAKVDRQLVPLRTVLQSGQLVEILTAHGARPNPAWLNFVVTAKARTNIRQYLKNLERAEAKTLGQQLLNQILSRSHTSLRRLDPESLSRLAQNLKLADVDELLVQIGLGERPAILVAHAILQSPGTEVTTPQSIPIVIRGTEGMVVTFARCCYPIPGDEIAGFLSAGRGMVIHRADCPNLLEHRKAVDKWIDVAWEAGLKKDFSIGFRVDAENQRGVLAQIASRIAELGSNIEQVSVTERDGLMATLTFVCAVRDRKQLANLFRHIHRLPGVIRIARART